MSAPLSPIPNDAAVIEPSFVVSRRWYLWLFEVWLRVRTLVAVVGSPYTKSNQSASIVNATIATITQTGLYRVSYYLHVTTIPTTSFSLTVTIGWREGGTTKSQSFTALTGAPGTLATAFQANTFPIRADSGTTVTMSVVYASVGATAMVYGVDAPVELIS